LGDARDFMLHQPEKIQLRQSWQRAAGLLLLRPTVLMWTA